MNLVTSTRSKIGPQKIEFSRADRALMHFVEYATLARTLMIRASIEEVPAIRRQRLDEARFNARQARRWYGFIIDTRGHL